MKKILFYISGAIHSNDISEISTVGIFSKYVSVSLETDSKKKSRNTCMIETH